MYLFLTTYYEMEKPPGKTHELGIMAFCFAVCVDQPRVAVVLHSLRLFVVFFFFQPHYHFRWV